MKSAVFNHKITKQDMQEQQKKFDNTVFDLEKALTNQRKNNEKLRNRQWFDPKKQRICQNCMKEFNEKSNFNWSCRTHQGDWGGNMWWCCGKTQLNSQGCRYQKHKVEIDPANNEEGGETPNKCFLCKELTHLSSECP